MSAQLERFVARLCELDLDPAALRSDPRGEAWLPAELRELVASDPECARELDEFVAMELALCELDEPSDPYFTRRVMERLPEIEAIDDRRRTWILASAYALAIGVAYVLLGPLLGSGELAGYVEPVRAWVRAEAGALEALGMWIALGLLLTAGLLSLAPIERRRADA